MFLCVCDEIMKDLKNPNLFRIFTRSFNVCCLNFIVVYYTIPYILTFFKHLKKILLPLSLFQILIDHLLLYCLSSFEYFYSLISSSTPSLIDIAMPVRVATHMLAFVCESASADRGAVQPCVTRCEQLCAHFGLHPIIHAVCTRMYALDVW